MQTLGEKFRLAREKRKITASQAAAATHMMIQHVEAIEANQFHKFAAAAYARGFIKLYAEYLGLEPAPLVREYVDRHMPKQRVSIVPDESTAPAAKQAAPATAPVPQSMDPSRAESRAPIAPNLALGRRWSAIRAKIMDGVAAMTRCVKTVSWKRPAMAAAVVVLAVAVTGAARCSGHEAGRQPVASAVRLPKSMSLIIQEPPEPYLQAGSARP